MWKVAAGAFALASYPAWALTPKEVYKAAGPAVVLLVGTGSAGTGSIISPEGLIVTNAHVVIGESGQPFEKLYVFLKPPKITGDNAKDLGNRFNGRVVAWSPKEELDLALVRIESPPGNLPTVGFGDPDQVEVGDEVVAIGHPEQGGLWTLTTGTVSTVIANFERVKGKNVFQTEASINRGNSGGPLLDTEGRIIGINTSIARQASDGVAITAVNFSLKSSVAVQWLAGQKVTLAYAGSSSGATPAVPQREASATLAPKATTAAPAQTALAAAPRPAAPADAAPAGKGQAEETVVSGQRLDPAKAKPKVLTEQRPFSLDDLRKQQMKEMDDMLDDMGSRFGGKKKKGW